MASVVLDLIERRRERRLPGGGPRWQVHAVLRPGQHVTLLNISSHAALVESDARLRPGAKTELQLATAGSRASVRGRLDRCHVATLAPLRYRGVLLFEHLLAVGDEEAGVDAAAVSREPGPHG
jgi:hypothetical protein